ncbi:MAG: phospholipase [Duncaniella sp.]|nr:phospholipase [Duncaniella sp.]
MTGALIILAVTVVTGFILWLTHRPERPTAEEPAATRETSDDGLCCGVHAICEKQMRLAEGPDYFDDEELDRFRGRDPENYTPDEIDEFREVMLTMRPDEVYAWASALTRRDIPFPVKLRPELLLLIDENA